MLLLLALWRTFHTPHTSSNYHPHLFSANTQKTYKNEKISEARMNIMLVSEFWKRDMVQISAFCPVTVSFYSHFALEFDFLIDSFMIWQLCIIGWSKTVVVNLFCIAAHRLTITDIGYNLVIITNDSNLTFIQSNLGIITWEAVPLIFWWHFNVRTVSELIRNFNWVSIGIIYYNEL